MNIFLQFLIIFINILIFRCVNEEWNKYCVSSAHVGEFEVMGKVGSELQGIFEGIGAFEKGGTIDYERNYERNYERDYERDYERNGKAHRVSLYSLLGYTDQKVGIKYYVEVGSDLN